jgi:hypothetical protein
MDILELVCGTLDPVCCFLRAERFAAREEIAREGIVNIGLRAPLLQLIEWKWRP